MSRFSEWTTRMGNHDAFHQSIPNKLIHALMIPVQLWGIVHLVSALINPLWFLLAISPVYVLCDAVSGASFVLFLYIISFIRSDTHFLWGAVMFVVANLIQTKIGHSFEIGGRDDTAINIAELKKTKNPVPTLLIFYYHWVEAFLMFGYRSDIKLEVARARAEQLKRF